MARHRARGLLSEGFSIVILVEQLKAAVRRDPEAARPALAEVVE